MSPVRIKGEHQGDSDQRWNESSLKVLISPDRRAKPIRTLFLPLGGHAKGRKCRATMSLPCRLADRARISKRPQAKPNPGKPNAQSGLERYCPGKKLAVMVELGRRRSRSPRGMPNFWFSTEPIMPPSSDHRRPRHSHLLPQTAAIGTLQTDGNDAEIAWRTMVSLPILSANSNPRCSFGCSNGRGREMS